MRSADFGYGLKRYIVHLAVSSTLSAQTLVFSDSLENAWLIASKQYGSKNIVSVNDPNRPIANKPTDKQSAIQFWANRFRKYARLAQPEPKPTEFADQVDDYLDRQDARSLARVKAEKAMRKMKKISNH